MPPGPRKSQITLIVAFAAIVAGVPLGQVVLELRAGRRVQFTDLVRYAPTERNLRTYEKTLEDDSWFQQTLRPRMQRAMLAALADPGPKALMGRDGWVFYRPGVEYLVEPDLPEIGDGGSAWVQPADEATRQDSVIRAIARFRDQLAARGLRLLVVPVPGKASVYPDKLTRRAAGSGQAFRSPTLGLMDELARRGVETVDLFAVFAQARRGRSAEGTGEALYLARDTHWTPAGLKLAAEAVAGKVRELGWTPNARREYATRRVAVRRRGDVLEMMQVPGLGERFEAESVQCVQVLDPSAGLLVARTGGREGTYANDHLRDTPRQAALLLLGDSFCRIYQLPEARSLGELAAPAAQTQPARRGRDVVTTKRLLPGSAGLPSHLAMALQSPVDYIVSDGGAATDVRRRLSANPAILEGKKVVVWLFAERDIRPGRRGWSEVPLP